MVALVIDIGGVFNKVYFPLGRVSTIMIGIKLFKGFRPQNPRLEYQDPGGSKSNGILFKTEEYA